LRIARLRRDRFTRGANHVRRRAQAVLADRVELLLRTGEQVILFYTYRLYIPRYLIYLIMKKLPPTRPSPNCFVIFYCYWIETAAAVFVNELSSVSCSVRSNLLTFLWFKNSWQYLWVGTLVEHLCFLALFSRGGGGGYRRSIVVGIRFPPAVHYAGHEEWAHHMCGASTANKAKSTI